MTRMVNGKKFEIVVPLYSEPDGQAGAGANVKAFFGSTNWSLVSCRMKAPKHS